MKAKTLGYFKNVQNVSYCSAGSELKVGMGVILDRAKGTAKLPSGDQEDKACHYIVSNINDKPEMHNFKDSLVVAQGEKVRADDLTTVDNMEMEFADYEISTSYASVEVGNKLVFGADGLLKTDGSAEGYKVYFEVIKKTAYMGKGVLVVVHVQCTKNKEE